MHSIDEEVRKLEEALRSNRKRVCDIQNELDLLPNYSGITDEIHQWQQECIDDFERSKKQLKRLRVAVDMEGNSEFIIQHSLPIIEQQLNDTKATLNIQVCL